jgi:hypothetical protein
MTEGRPCARSKGTWALDGGAEGCCAQGKRSHDEGMGGGVAMSVKTGSGPIMWCCRALAERNLSQDGALVVLLRERAAELDSHTQRLSHLIVMQPLGRALPSPCRS